MTPKKSDSSQFVDTAYVIISTRRTNRADQVTPNNKGSRRTTTSIPRTGILAASHVYIFMVLIRLSLRRLFMLVYHTSEFTLSLCHLQIEYLCMDNTNSCAARKAFLGGADISKNNVVLH
jgi:hypothetical protein